MIVVYILLIFAFLYCAWKAHKYAQAAIFYAKKSQAHARQALRFARQAQGLPPLPPESRAIREGVCPDKPDSYYLEREKP